MRSSSNDECRKQVPACKKTDNRRCNPGNCKGQLFIIGIGPGGEEHLTLKAVRLLKSSNIVIGYSTYIRLINKIIKDKNIYEFPMLKEIDRCSKAIDLALEDNKVSIISSGDPGIYGMAGLVIELLHKKGVYTYFSSRDIFFHEEKKEDGQPLYLEIISGVPSFAASASLLGAPLMHDFAVISLSDRLTPWNDIERRLEHAAKSDFVIVLMNPYSKGRAAQYKRAIEILRECRGEVAFAGIIKNATRYNESVELCTLKDISDYDADMSTTIIIGKSTTTCLEDIMLTPRGYSVKEEYPY